MGCDIHFHTEVKINGEWHHYSEVGIDRNYRLFAKMANVRNHYEDIEPISDPRGLPEDASFLTKFASDEYGVDGHSHSWLGATEIVELDEWIEKHLLGPDNAWKLERTFWGYLFGNSWSGFMKYPEDRPKGVENVRFVFWFDN